MTLKAWRHGLKKRLYLAALKNKDCCFPFPNIAKYANIFFIKTDIDIIVDFERGNLMKFVEAARKLKLKPKVPVKLDDFIDAEKDNRGLTIRA